MNTYHNQPYLENLSTQSVHTLTGTVIIGRHQDCNLVLKSERGASRKHARITVDNDNVLLMDLGSLNGTLVNGKEINRAVQLSDGDILIFDEEEYRFVSPATTLSGSDNVTVIANKDEIGRPDRIKPAIRVVETAPASIAKVANEAALDETQSWASLNDENTDADQDNKVDEHQTGQHRIADAEASGSEASGSEASGSEASSSEASSSNVPSDHDQHQHDHQQSTHNPEPHVSQTPASQSSLVQDSLIQTPEQQNAQTQNPQAREAQVSDAQAQESYRQDSRVLDPQIQQQEKQAQRPTPAHAIQSENDAQHARKEQAPNLDNIERGDSEQPLEENQVYDQQGQNQRLQNQVGQLHDQDQQPPRSDSNKNRDPYPPFPATSRPGGNARPARRGLPKHYGANPYAIQKAKRKRLLIIIPLFTLFMIAVIYLAFIVGFSAGNSGSSNGFS